MISRTKHTTGSQFCLQAVIMKSRQSCQEVAVSVMHKWQRLPQLFFIISDVDGDASDNMSRISRTVALKSPLGSVAELGRKSRPIASHTQGTASLLAFG